MVLQNRTVAKATGAAAVAPIKAAATAADLVTTAELVRGRVYFYKNIEFETGRVAILEDAINTPAVKVITDVAVLAAELEDLHEETKDSDGEVFEKAVFRVLYNQERPAKEPTLREQRQVRRLPVRALPVRNINR